MYNLWIDLIYDTGNIWTDEAGLDDGDSIMQIVVLGSWAFGTLFG